MTTYRKQCRCGVDVDFDVPEELLGDLAPAMLSLSHCIACDDCCEAHNHVKEMGMDEAVRVAKDGGVPVKFASEFDKSKAWGQLLAWMYVHADRNRSMLVTGATGGSKTRITARMALRALQRRQCRYVHWFRDSDLRRLAASMQREGLWDYRVWRESILGEGKLLVIDDLGKSSLTDSAREFYWDLFDTMYLQGDQPQGVVWITTNLSRDDVCGLFGKMYSTPMQRRIVERFATWPDDASKHYDTNTPAWARDAGQEDEERI